MIPVFQTRTGTEGPGNCFEACIASILELPLSAIPDRRAYLDPAAWRSTIDEARARGGDEAVLDLEMPGLEEWEAALKTWLADRGLAFIELELDGRLAKTVRQTLSETGGYWIAIRRSDAGTAHAVVELAGETVHNPMRGVLADELLGDYLAAWVMVAGDPPKIARTLGVECLPDVVGALTAVAGGGAGATVLSFPRRSAGGGA